MDSNIQKSPESKEKGIFSIQLQLFTAIVAKICFHKLLIDVFSNKKTRRFLAFEFSVLRLLSRCFDVNKSNLRNLRNIQPENLLATQI